MLPHTKQGSPQLSDITESNLLASTGNISHPPGTELRSTHILPFQRLLHLHILNSSHSRESLQVTEGSEAGVHSSSEAWRWWNTSTFVYENHPSQVLLRRLDAHSQWLGPPSGLRGTRVPAIPHRLCLGSLSKSPSLQESSVLMPFSQYTLAGSSGPNSKDKRKNLGMRGRPLVSRMKLLRFKESVQNTGWDSQGPLLQDFPGASLS